MQDTAAVPSPYRHPPQRPTVPIAKLCRTGNFIKRGACPEGTVRRDQPLRVIVLH